MPLSQFKASDFRCLESVVLDLDTRANLITGANAAGKTSILEAIAYLGRGRSFRGAPTQSLVRHGQKSFLVFGNLSINGRQLTLGVRNSADGLEISVDGEGGRGAAALAEELPLQVIGPDVHDLVGGGPEQRRKYLDWLSFHVEHSYLDAWRRFRRALKQRNAALKGGVGDSALDVWDQEFVALAEVVSSIRRRVFDRCVSTLEGTAATLLEAPVSFELGKGWPDNESLAEILMSSRERDRTQGNTQSGPQRAEIRLRYDERQAKRLVSRGQQKLLACSMIIAAVETVQNALESPLLLLIDDPAAELDSDSLGRLMRGVNDLGCQVVATSLVSGLDIFDAPPALFHVEHGVLSRRS